MSNFDTITEKMETNRVGHSGRGAVIDRSRLRGYANRVEGRGLGAQRPASKVLKHAPRRPGAVQDDGGRSLRASIIYLRKLISRELDMLGRPLHLAPVWPHRTRRDQVFAGAGALLIVFTMGVPLLSQLVTSHRYSLNAQTQQLLGPTNSNLVSKITYDSATSSYYFNKDGIKSDDTSPAAALQNQIGGAGKKDKSLYSVQLPTDPKQGITYYDDNLDIKFSLVPEMKLLPDQQTGGRIVYAGASGVQDVYTTKNNGLKDDIVLTKNQGDQLSYSYKLNLPSTLQAKMIGGTGEIGIYSADPALFNNVSFGSSHDEALVNKARQHSPKTNLVFVLPAPTIKQFDSKTHQAVTAPASAHFVLSPSGKELTVAASGLSKLSYPLTIDPSVVTTSSSDFSSGNNEGNIDYSTADQITRGALTGGTLTGGWSNSTNTFTTARNGAASVAYNGNLYVIGGNESASNTSCKNAGTSAYCNDIQYSAINASTGALGSWTTNGTFFSIPRAFFGAAAYNGYLYIMGGVESASNTSCKNAGTSTVCNDIQYAPINSNGSVGSWTTASTFFSTPRQGLSTVVYNGFLYIMGGTSGTFQNDVQYAVINADGSLGSWTTNGTSFTTARQEFGAVAYNGYLYVVGGLEAASNTSCKNAGTSTNCNDIQYAPINANGSVGAWNTSTNFLATPRYGLSVMINNGYLYVVAGYNGTTYQNDSQLATVNAGGTIGSFTTSTTIATARNFASAANYNGYLYIMGGTNGTIQSDTQLAQIDSPGVAGATAWTTGTSTAVGQAMTCDAAFDGVLFQFGGTTNGTTYTTNTYQALIGADGTLGSWSPSATAFTTGRGSEACGGYNGYLYVIGGTTNGTTPLADVQYAPLTVNNATLGAWTTATNALPAAEMGTGAAFYNGFMYVTGGIVSGGSLSANTYVSTPSVSTGAPGTWSTTSALTNLVNYPSVMTYDGYLYAVGGTASGGVSSFVQRAVLNANGTLGTWTSQTGSFSARTQQAAAIFSGYMYVYGGWDGSTTATNDLNYAQVNADGSVGSFATSTSFTTARYGMGYAAYDGMLYLSSGDRSSAPTFGTDSEYIALNNGGRGTATWSTTASLQTLLGGAGHGTALTAVAAYNGFLYSIGGDPDGGTSSSAIYIAPINPDGSLGTWVSSTTSLNTSRGNAQAIAYNGFMYVLGGFGTSVDNYEYAQINANGTLQAFTTGSNFASLQTAGLGATEYNGYIYIVGGNNSGTFYTDVEYALINANGSLGTWTQTTAMSTAATEANQVAAYNGYLYIFGGTTTGGAANELSTIQYAPINSNGTIGSFTSIANGLPWQKWGIGDVEVSNGYVYLFSGLGFLEGGSSARPNTYYAAFGPNGTIGPWNQTTSFGTPHDSGGSAVYNGVLYEVGGLTAGGPTYFPDVNYAPINSIARIGHYSKLIDLGSATNALASITYNGSVPAGLMNISYETAGSNGVFGSTSNAYVLDNATPGACAAGGSQRYIWVNVTLDGSGGGTIFPDALSNYANVTDLTMTYAAGHPPPNIRMRAGQTLQTGNLSPLDTCFP